MQPLLTDLLTFRKPLLPSSEWSLFGARCRHGDQIVVDLRKLVGRLVSVHRLVFLMCITSLIHRWSILLLSLSITLAWSQSDMVERDGVVCECWLVLIWLCSTMAVVCYCPWLLYFISASPAEGLLSTLVTILPQVSWCSFLPPPSTQLLPDWDQHLNW